MKIDFDWPIVVLLAASIVGLTALLLLPTCAQGAPPPPPSLVGDVILPPWAQAAPEGTTEEPQGGIYRVYFDTREQLTALAVHFDVWEVSKPGAGYATMGLDAESAAGLMAQGYRLELDIGRTKQHLLGPPGYPCYRDVDQLYEYLQQIAADYPHLTELTDYGDSWRKVNLGASQGYDLLALKITNSQVQGPKPRFFLMATIHARELTTPETVVYFIEYLLDNYDNDPDATWIVDHHEVYVVVVANPDGRQLVEQDCMQRKNRNDTLGSCTLCDPGGDNHYGVDLNRNNPYHWGGAGTDPCGQTYQGTLAASEPETYHLINFVRSIIPDQRPDDDVSPAPDDTTGLLISMHSYSNLVLWPWGWTYGGAPNESQLRTLGRKFAYFNNYTPEQSSDLYATTGDTTDWVYGELGIPAYTFELGESFFQPCDDLEQIMEENLGALLYAAKTPRTPYVTPAGPDVLGITVVPTNVWPSEVVSLTAIVDDTRYNNSNGAEPTQSIAAAAYYVDTPSWITTTMPVTYYMTAMDGGFDEEIEEVEATIDTTGLGLGRHTIFVRGQDADGYWGPFTAVWLYVRASVMVEPETAALMGDPSTSVTYTLRITNTGIYTDSYWITTTSHSWAMVVAPDSVFNLEPNAGADVAVQVVVAPAALAGEQDVATVTVTSLGDGITSAGAVLTTTANAVHGVAMTPAAGGRGGLAGRTVTCTLHVSNTGNITGAYSLSRLESGWPTVFSPAGTFTLGSSDRQNVEVYVTIPVTAVPGERDVALVQVQGTYASNTSTLTTTVLHQIFLPLVVRGYG